MPCRWQKSSRVPSSRREIPRLTTLSTITTRTRGNRNSRPSPPRSRSSAAKSRSHSRPRSRPLPQTAAGLKLYSSQKTKRFQASRSRMPSVRTPRAKIPAPRQIEGFRSMEKPSFQRMSHLTLPRKSYHGNQGLSIPPFPKDRHAFLRGCTRVPPVLPFGAGPVWGKTIKQPPARVDGGGLSYWHELAYQKYQSSDGLNYLPSATSLMDLDRISTALSQSTPRTIRGGTIRMTLEPMAVTRKWFLMQ